MKCNLPKRKEGKKVGGGGVVAASQSSREQY